MNNPDPTRKLLKHFFHLGQAAYSAVLMKGSYISNLINKLYGFR